MSRFKSKVCAGNVAETIIKQYVRPVFVTLTTPDIISGKELGKRFNFFLTQFKRDTTLFHKVWNPTTKRYNKRILKESDIHGMRVVEPHADGERLHIHMILSYPISADYLWELAERCGFGRVDIRFVNKNKPFDYLVKYVGKVQREASLHGVRLWSEFSGKGAKRTGLRCKDVEVRSSFHSLWNDSEVREEIALTDEQVIGAYTRHCAKVEAHNALLRELYGVEERFAGYRVYPKTGEKLRTSNNRYSCPARTKKLFKGIRFKRAKTFKQFKSFLQLLNFKNTIWDRYSKCDPKTEDLLMQRMRYEIWKAGLTSHIFIVDVDELVDGGYHNRRFVD